MPQLKIKPVSSPVVRIRVLEAVARWGEPATPSAVIMAWTGGRRPRVATVRETLESLVAAGELSASEERDPRTGERKKVYSLASGAQKNTPASR